MSQRSLCFVEVFEFQKCSAVGDNGSDLSHECFTELISESEHDELTQHTKIIHTYECEGERTKTKTLWRI